MKKLVVLLGIIFMGFWVGEQAEANSLDVFEVTIAQPSSQINSEQTYLNLELAPNQKESFDITVKNKTDQALKIQPSFNRAVTNNSGVIEYSGKRAESGKFHKKNIEDFITFDDTQLQLAPQEVKTLKAEINMPAEEFTGILAGGFYFEEVPEGEFNGSVRNIYSRETALLIRNNQSDITPELEIVAAKPIQENGRNMIELTIDNPEAIYVHQLNISHQVTADQSDFLAGEKGGMSIAPQSQLKYLVPLAGTSFKNGEYTVNVVATSKDRRWQASPSFTINQQAAKDLNAQDVTIEKQGLPWWVWLIIGLIVLQFIVIALLFNKKRTQ